jgi:hypothetical protein
MDAAPDMFKRPRREEILAWLKERPNVKRYVVIDDEDDELDDLPLFQPSAKTGISGKTNETMRRNVLERLVQNVEGIFKRDKS